MKRVAYIILLGIFRIAHRVPHKFVFAISSKLYTQWKLIELPKANEGIHLAYPVIVCGGKYIELKDGVCFSAGSILTAWDYYRGEVFTPAIIVGRDTIIGEDCHITAINRIQIGANVLLGKKVTITDNSHGCTDAASLLIPPRLRPLVSKEAVYI